MSDVTKPACPKCGFDYSWNGTTCGHCRYPEVDATPSSKPKGFLASVFWKLLIFGGLLLLFLFGCLLEIGTFKNRAGWLGVTDYTYVYLIGSIVIGLIEVIGAVLLFRNQGRYERISVWLLGLTAIWIPITAGMALGMLPNMVPRWLVYSYLGVFVLPILLALWVYQDFLKKAIFREASPGEYPASSRGEAVLSGVLHSAYMGACCVILALTLNTDARIGSAFDELAANVDGADAVLEKMEALPTEKARSQWYAALNEHQNTIVARSRELAEEPLTRGQTAKLGALMKRANEQLTRENERLKKVSAELANRKKAAAKKASAPDH